MDGEHGENTTQGLTVVATGLQDLADAHPYIEGRVAPQRILDADRARIMHLAFDAGQELKEHKAPVPILIQVLEGRFTFTVGESTNVLTPGALLHLTAALPHAVLAHEPSRLTITMLRGDD